MRQLSRSLVLAALPLSLLSAAVAQAGEVELPRTMAWTAYGTNSSGYAQAVAIGNMLQNHYGTSVRILPGDNDVSRMTPLKQGRVDLCACGIASYYGAEGVMMFANRDWGPQPIRVITTSTASFGLSLAVAGDLGVETPADLAGKRIAYIRGDDALNKGTEAYLAFGGLTWDDVDRVDFPGYARSFDGIIAGNVDASFTTTVTPPAQQLASSPRGISWPVLDPDDAEGWERMMAVAPYFRPHEVTAGAGNVSADNPVPSASYPYPIVVANQDLDDNVAYGLIKALQDNYDDYKDAAPGAVGYAFEYQDLQWVVPFHDAVVAYYEEIGVWTEDMQAHQEALVERQELLLATWNDFLGDAPDDEEEFEAAWMQARAEALREAGLDPVFE
ncbi:TAXI family TRAP transporter solute-binding subunit [Billgrantia aerodenitrificans]|uniref:TAXI family TRAP transporter solute-binding subunit n=1 Tax=Billgrantia aerodenitrificans TaxID=2733483 RepID=A0ABS9ASE8_9GAMM|nr:TAXI family TRAP transporter solute-binding subunit [Halomonas aerodenitrificans]MCE8024659.1 TAXI family TRAP transporter solute-binding subunit [Halomonas aerodenitrificans]